MLLICFIIFLDKGSGDCIQQTAKLGQQNIYLNTSFSWDVQEPKFIQCNKNQTVIGQCSAVTTSSCSVDPQNVGVYEMNSTDDLISVIITIKEFTETLSGIYSCSKTNEKNKTTICLTTETTSAASSGLSVGTVVGISVGVIFEVAFAVTIGILCYCRKKKLIPLYPARAYTSR
ncbi:hypothetical protein DPMN_132330 [Dreissena polymorpha]|uniref:Uncharacterized protein n=2 Tax=Dreissena polymorpha TaxID=45954 RepID=A0A9D4FS90_DREPO|nr:hypothetical protein DPMN_132330 [Dreissena polymorpha]